MIFAIYLQTTCYENKFHIESSENHQFIREVCYVDGNANMSIGNIYAPILRKITFWWLFMKFEMFEQFRIRQWKASSVYQLVCSISSSSQLKHIHMI